MKAYIIEDEPHAQRALQQLVALVAPDVQIIGVANSVEKAVVMIKANKPDFIFLDVQLGSATGFNLLSQFPEPDFSILFVTAFNEYAIEAFQWNAVHYLTKPIDSAALKEGIDRVRTQRSHLSTKQIEGLLQHNIPETNKYIVLRYDAVVERQPLDEIIRLEANGGLTFFYCIEEDLITKKRSVQRKVVSNNIGHYERLLPDVFFRCHQSHIVNRQFVKLYNKSENYLLLHTQTQVPVSRRGKAGIEIWLTNHNQ